MSVVAVLLLNWRQYQQTAICLESLYALESVPKPTLYLIDNESNAESLDNLLQDYPEVIRLPQETNLGFAAGMNVGIKRALSDGADYVLLLNNDTMVTPPVLRQMLGVFENKHLKVGIVGPSLRPLPPEKGIESVGLEVNRWNGRVTLRHQGVLPEDLYPYPHQVDAISGACLMVSRKILEEIGPLDESYFFYFEDIDLCLRTRAAGWNVYVTPMAIVYHKGGATMGLHPDRTYYGIRNQLKMIEERGLKVSAPIAIGRSLFIVTLNALRLKKEGALAAPNHMKGLLQGIQDHRRRQYGVRV